MRIGLTILTLCFQVLGSWGLVKNHWDIDFIAEVYATAPQRDTVPVSGSCDYTPVTAFSPNVATTYTFSGSRTAGPTCSATMDLTNPVNSDTAPSLGCNVTDVGGFAVASSRTPTIKIGGLICSTQDRAQMQVHGDGSDNTNFDIAISTVGSTSWDASKKVDASTSSSKIMLFGSGGQVGTSDIIDGQDADGLTNGEVTFGGTVASQGGSRIYTKLDFTGYVPDPAVDRETLTFTLTMR